MLEKREHSVWSVLSVVSYGFAVITLTAGLILTVVIGSAAGDVPDALSGLRGLGPLLNPFVVLLTDTIHTAVELAAVAVFVFAVLTSALLLAMGGLLAAVHGLERRVRDLENSRLRDPSQHALRTPESGA